MYGEKNCIEEQSIFLDVDLDKEIINGRTTIKFGIENPGFSQDQVPTIYLCAKQIIFQEIQVVEAEYFDDTSTLPKKLESDQIGVTCNYPNISTQASQMESISESVRGLDGWLRIARMNNIFQNKGLFEININFKDTEQIIISRFKHFTLTVLIKYELSSPVAGMRFRKIQVGGLSKVLLFNENKVGYSRYWVPCLDDIKQKVFIKQVIIQVPSNYLAICSGMMAQQTIDEGNFKTVYQYDVAKKLSINQIGVCIGQFQSYLIQSDNANLYCFYLTDLKEKIKYTFENTRLLQEMREFFKGYLSLSPLQFYKILVIPGMISSINSLEIPISFYDMSLIDDKLILTENILEKQNYRKSLIFRSIAWSSLHDLHLFSPSEFWIKLGLHGYITDLFYSLVANETEYKIFFQKRFENMLNFIQKGREIFPIGAPLFSHEAEMFFNEAFILKSHIVFQMLTTIIYFDNAKRLIKLLVEDRVINNENFFKLIKTNFGIKKLKYFKNQFVKKTGCPIFDVEYNHVRKENKVDIKIIQTPLQKEYYQEYTEHRLQLENLFKIENEVVKILSHQQPIHEKFQYVNKKSESCKTFMGNISILASETNEIESREEPHPEMIEKKRETKLTITLKGKLRKTVQKKYDYEDDEGSMMEKSFAGNSSYHDPTKKVSILNMTSGSRNPALWIKLDPDNRYLKSVNIQQSDSLWLLQFNYDKDLAAQYAALEALRNFPNNQVINNLCTMLESKEHDYRIKVRIIDVLLSMDQETTGARAVDNLYNFANKVKVEHDGSLKSNDFSQKAEYFMLKKVIKKLCILREKSRLPIQASSEEPLTNASHIKLFLRFIKENDNTRNTYDDTNYLATVLGSLLSTKNPYFVKKILKETLRYLKLELVTSSYQNRIGLKILKKINEYLYNHDLLDPDSIVDEKIRLIVIEISKTIEKFELKFREDPQMISRYLFCKIQEKRYKGIKVWEILIYALKYIEHCKIEKRFHLMEILLETIFNFIADNKIQFYNMQRMLTLESNKAIVDILWELLNHGYSSISIKYRHYLYLIYREIYYDMVPLCYYREFPEKIEYDVSWLDFESTNKPILESQKEKRIITLKYLNLNKRKKARIFQIIILPISFRNYQNQLS